MIGPWLPPILEAKLMLVPADFRRCVAYLTVDVRDKDTGLISRRPAGTGFFVSIPAEDQGTVIYLVTARHVIDASRKYGQLYLRVNTTGSESVDGRLSHQDDWFLHPQTDVACMAVNLDNVQQPDIRTLPLDVFLSDERLANVPEGAVAVCEGDEVVNVGLFTSHPGSASRSEPVVRFGHIARMPYDPIPIKMDPAPNGAYTPVDAYLCEANSYGGQSGSPIFIYFAMDRVPGTINMGGEFGGGSWALLGLVHGHYPDEQDIKVTSGELTGEGKIDFNLGISVVIPAQDILNLLNSEDAVEQRKKAADEQRAKSVPVADNAALSAVEGEQGEYERFDSLLGEMVNTPKPKPKDKS